ncbi:MAG: hypothetical protein HC856_07970 [Pseudanabaena sp. RU_4_16]|nr:hypothetical protein [Pseudanabaena sp. RU_4_16]
MQLSIECTTRPTNSNPRALRRSGRVPATVYGHKGAESTAISLDVKDTTTLLRHAKINNTMIELSVTDGDFKGLALLREVQSHQRFQIQLPLRPLLDVHRTRRHECHAGDRLASRHRYRGVLRQRRQFRRFGPHRRSRIHGGHIEIALIARCAGAQRRHGHHRPNSAAHHGPAPLLISRAHPSTLE